MNKLTKVGCSALCGSLAAISAANAGDLAVTGSAHVTYMSHGGQTTGNPIGMQSSVGFSGSGELDNGWTFGFNIDETDTVAFSAARVNITMGGLGTIEFDGGNSGNGIAAYDNVLPTAWEEAHGAGVSGGVKTVLGVGASDNIQYTLPTVLGTTIAVTYAREVGSSDTADKSTGHTSDNVEDGVDLTIKMNPSLGTEILSGLNIFAGASTIERNDTDAPLNDAYEGVGGVTYDIGPLSLGAQWSGEYTGAKTIDGDGPAGQESVYNFYKNFAYGMAFNINDDLSLSYGEWRARKAGYTDSSTEQTDEANRTVTVTSFQIAYTMGGASIRIADTEVDNQSWTANQNRSVTTVSMGLAF